MYIYIYILKYDVLCLFLMTIYSTGITKYLHISMCNLLIKLIKSSDSKKITDKRVVCFEDNLYLRGICHITYSSGYIFEGINHLYFISNLYILINTD